MYKMNVNTNVFYHTTQNTSHQVELYMSMASEPLMIPLKHLRRTLQRRRRRRQILPCIWRPIKYPIVTRIIHIMTLILPDVTVLPAGGIRSVPAFIILLPAFVNGLHGHQLVSRVIALK